VVESPLDVEAVEAVDEAADEPVPADEGVTEIEVDAEVESGEAD
jgi:hypothetical protein